MNMVGNRTNLSNRLKPLLLAGGLILSASGCGDDVKRPNDTDRSTTTSPTAYKSTSGGTETTAGAIDGGAPRADAVGTAAGATAAGGTTPGGEGPDAAGVGGSPAPGPGATAAPTPSPSPI